MRGIIENTFRMALYAMEGIITFDVIRQALLLAPLMLVGLFLGMHSGKYMDEKIVRKIVIIMLVISGSTLIMNNLMNSRNLE